jgi:dihydroorotate dehydrogenase
LEDLLTCIIKARDELQSSPITAQQLCLVLKIASDLEESQIVDIADIICKSSINDIIISNTTISHPGSLMDCESTHCHLSNHSLIQSGTANKAEIGGLSGALLKLRALQILKTLSTHVPASIPLIGCRGVNQFWPTLALVPLQ